MCYHGTFSLQDNVYNTTRRKKMSLFEGFKKKACACIVSAEERRRRERRREDNSEVPLHVLRNMQGEHYMSCHVTSSDMSCDMPCDRGILNAKDGIRITYGM